VLKILFVLINHLNVLKFDIGYLNMTTCFHLLKECGHKSCKHFQSGRLFVTINFKRFKRKIQTKRFDSKEQFGVTLKGRAVGSCCPIWSIQ